MTRTRSGGGLLSVNSSVSPSPIPFKCLLGYHSAREHVMIPYLDVNRYSRPGCVQQPSILMPRMQATDVLAEQRWYQFADAQSMADDRNMYSFLSCPGC